MSFLNFFFGSSPKKLERKGDAFFASGQWADARQCYERALYKLDKSTRQQETESIRRVSEKIDTVCEELANEQHHKAQHFLRGGYYNEALEMTRLAFETSRNPLLQKELLQQLEFISKKKQNSIPESVMNPSPDNVSGTADDPTDDSRNHVDQRHEIAPDEKFFALIQTLPDDVQGSYLAYGPEFQAGYLALNNGDYEAAVQNLLKAMKIAGPKSYVPMELAAAYLKLGRAFDARKLLENFLRYHPDALPAYQLLCELYWQKKECARVETLLASIPEDLTESLAVVLLKGENLHQAGSYEESKLFYENILKTYGWNETIVRELAKTCETLGLPEKARSFYHDIVQHCISCGKEADPQVRHKYAELSFAAGRYGTDILDMYLALAGELPEKAFHYYDRVSRIYAVQGNSHEADRFRAFSAEARKERIKENH